MLDWVWAVRPGRRGALRAVALFPLLVGLMSCSSDEQDAPARKPAKQSEAATKSLSPLTGRALYVDPQSPAALQASRWRSQGRAGDAAAMARLAKRPTAEWLADEAEVTSRVRAATQKAARANRAALLVAYHVPGRDCGSYSAGGSGSAEGYRAWVRRFARGIGSRRAAVILEPDAIPQAVTESCLSAASKAERYALLADAVKTFAALPNVAVYLDAGNPGWVRPVGGLVGPLRRSGIEHADGFALNVSNFFRTGTVIEYGRALSRRLGGAHFVIDTSRNGNGPTLEDDPGGPKWCNPPGRAVGRSPSTNTGQREVDAYLWVKRPGASDGSCRAGAPPAGHWWPEYALQLVRNR
ncbi:MAG: glycoside hydrolase family 6 protein [Thermoleophilaceae bacterium]|nr:glycoside hydrolase family 6 protein [Thermoleophilaceae bacterium]